MQKSMHKILTLILLLVLAGCNTAPKKIAYGNFIDPQAPGLDRQIAKDALQQIGILYPPAKTSFELQQPTIDAFGADLVIGLRDAGYALIEYNPEQKNEEESEFLTLSYILDLAGEKNLYRLTMQISKRSINRAYRNENGSVVPAGQWSRSDFDE